MVRVHHQRTPSTESPRTEVGEIDTRAPFQSVRAAVSLFGAVATMKGKPSLPSFKKQSSSLSSSESARAIGGSNRVTLDKESQLMLAEKELNKYKQRLESAEATKARALADLENATKALEELNTSIRNVNQSKQLAIVASETVKQQAMKLHEETSTDDGAWRQELERAREQYKTVSSELDAAKQYLTKIRQDYDAASEAKSAAFQQASEAQSTADHHKDRAAELRKEIATAQDSIETIKLATHQSNRMLTKINNEKEAILRSYKPAKEEAENKLQALKQEFEPEMAKNLEMQLAEVNAEIEVVQEEMKRAHEMGLNSVKVVTDELDEATKTLQKVAAEESALRTSVASLRMQLENVKRGRAEAEEKVEAMEYRTANLREQLESSKEELKTLAEMNSDEHIARVHQLISEAEDAIQEAEEMRRNTDELKQETKTAQTAKEDAEKLLQVAMTELEGVKAREKHAIDELKSVSKVCSMDFGVGGAKIRMSKKDYEVLCRKNEEAGNLAEMKVAAVMFQVGVISGNKSEVISKIEAVLKEMEEIQVATDSALKQAQMSEAAQRAIETELQRWREQEKSEIQEK